MRKLVLPAVIGCLLVGGAIFAQTRHGPPPTLGLDVSSHSLAPGVKHAKVNGQVWVDVSLPGSAVTGDVAYGSGDLLQLELTWLDLLDGKVWRSSVDLPAAELPTFGGKGEHASIRVQLGPGADVAVISGSPAEMALIDAGDADALATTPREEIVLATACGSPVPAGDPIIPVLKSGFDEAEREQAMAARERAQSRGETTKSRCGE